MHCDWAEGLKRAAGHVAAANCFQLQLPVLSVHLLLIARWQLQRCNVDAIFCTFFCIRFCDRNKTFDRVVDREIPALGLKLYL